MKYMRNYATEDNFKADKPNMDSIESDGKIWMSYIKEHKTVKTKYRLRPKYNYNAIEPSTDKLSWEGGIVEFDVYLIEPQSELHLYLPDAYKALCGNLDTRIIQEKINKLHYKFKFPYGDIGISPNTYNNEISYPFYIEGDEPGKVLASCTITQAGKPYNKTVNQNGYVTGIVKGLGAGVDGQIDTVPGADVQVKGTSSMYTQTGMDGRFSLHVNDGRDTPIQITFIPYKQVEIASSTVDELNILLVPDDTNIDIV